MGRALESLFSDRRRGWKAGGFLGLAVLLSALFQVGEAHQDLGFLQLARLSGPGLPPGAVVGPEHLRVLAVGPDGVRAGKFGVELHLAFPRGPAGEEARRAAAALRAGDHVSVSAHHRGGGEFELLTLRKNPRRVLKLAVSGAAAVVVLVAFPFCYRWRQGAFRARSAERGRGGASAQEPARASCAPAPAAEGRS